MNRHPLIANATLTTVPTNALAVGDLIVCHGGLFRVLQTKIWPDMDDTAATRGHTQSNYCEFLGNAFDYECSIPAHWRDGRPAASGRPALDNFWNAQGNGLARTTKVVS